MGKSASRGTSKIPAEANQAGEVNNSPRQGDLRHQTKASEVDEKEMAPGPQVGETGEYKPATYKVTKLRKPYPQSKPKKFEIIVEDF